jgi:toxin ParE1/3/4
MPHQVLLTEDAETDFHELYDYIAHFDSVRSADHILERLLEVADTLAAEPQRGSIPKELRALGLNEYRQVFFKPYRIVYRIHDEQVVIYLITDGRRNMQTLLSRRLLRG